MKSPNGFLMFFLDMVDNIYKKTLITTRTDQMQIDSIFFLSFFFKNICVWSWCRSSKMCCSEMGTAKEQ